MVLANIFKILLPLKDLAKFLLLKNKLTSKTYLLGITAILENIADITAVSIIIIIIITNWEIILKIPSV